MFVMILIKTGGTIFWGKDFVFRSLRNQGMFWATTKSMYTEMFSNYFLDCMC